MKLTSLTRRARRGFMRPSDVKTDSRQMQRDFDHEFLDLLTRVQPFTMTTPERLYGLREATRYVSREHIPGDCVECGVWRGGSSMAVALGLLDAGDHQRRLWLYDTFAGMTAPGERDEAEVHRRFAEISSRGKRWISVPLEEVRANLESTGFPDDRLEFVVGKVEDTIPRRAPRTISLLRLDTDWYESTRHELVHLWPRLSSGGVLIIDDYGHWEGARKAVDDFFDEVGSRPLFARLDYTGRMLVKR
jgi:O-methyltransferase